MEKVICPCCGCELTESDINNGLVWGVELLDLELYKKFGVISTKVFNVCDSCFCEFGEDILPYDDEDVKAQYPWLKDELFETYLNNYQTGVECGYFMLKIPKKF